MYIHPKGPTQGADSARESSRAYIWHLATHQLRPVAPVLGMRGLRNALGEGRSFAPVNSQDEAGGKSNIRVALFPQSPTPKFLEVTAESDIVCNGAISQIGDSFAPGHKGVIVQFEFPTCNARDFAIKLVPLDRDDPEWRIAGSVIAEAVGSTFHRVRVAEGLLPGCSIVPFVVSGADGAGLFALKVASKEVVLASWLPPRFSEHVFASSDGGNVVYSEYRPLIGDGRPRTRLYAVKMDLSGPSKKAESIILPERTYLIGRTSGNDVVVRRDNVVSVSNMWKRKSHTVFEID